MPEFATAADLPSCWLAKSIRTAAQLNCKTGATIDSKREIYVTVRSRAACPAFSMWPDAFPALVYRRHPKSHNMYITFAQPVEKALLF